MSAFEERYAAWRARPFPDGSATDAIDELHADLAGIDAVVAETVVPFVKHGTYNPAKIDVIRSWSDSQTGPISWLAEVATRTGASLVPIASMCGT
jgi:hypothetical protein